MLVVVVPVAVPVLAIRAGRPLVDLVHPVKAMMVAMGTEEALTKTLVQAVVVEARALLESTHHRTRVVPVVQEQPALVAPLLTRPMRVGVVERHTKLVIRMALVVQAVAVLRGRLQCPEKGADQVQVVVVGLMVAPTLIFGIVVMAVQALSSSGMRCSHG
jgi:hypothetical protein